MSDNIISLLEKIGAQAELRYNSQAIYQAITQITDNQVLVDGLQQGNVSQLEQVMQLRQNLVCGLHPAEDGAEEQPAEEAPEPEEQEPKPEAQRKAG